MFRKQGQISNAEVLFKKHLFRLLETCEDIYMITCFNVSLTMEENKLQPLFCIVAKKMVLIRPSVQKVFHNGIYAFGI